MSTAGRAGAGDSGTSLVEVTLAIALLGLAVASVIPAMFGVVRASSRQEHLADAHRWIAGAGDVAASTLLGRVPCATPSDYEATIRAGTDELRPPDWSPTQLAVTSVEYWSGSSFTTACAESATVPLTLQRITLQVTAPDGRALDSLQVVTAPHEVVGG